MRRKTVSCAAAKCMKKTRDFRLSCKLPGVQFLNKLPGFSDFSGLFPP